MRTQGRGCARHRKRRRNGSTRRWREIRLRALMRDKRCVVCGSTEYLEVHHVVSVADGGRDKLSNLRTLCDDCHREGHRP